MRRAKPNDRFDQEQTRRRTRFASSRPNENFLSLPPQRFQVSLILFCSFKVLTEGKIFFHLSFTLLVRYRSLIVI